jgi:hypothetical protein
MNYGTMEHYRTTSPAAIPDWQNNLVVAVYVVIYALILFGFCKFVYWLFRYFFAKNREQLNLILIPESFT